MMGSGVRSSLTRFTDSFDAYRPRFLADLASSAADPETDVPAEPGLPQPEPSPTHDEEASTTESRREGK